MGIVLPSILLQLAVLCCSKLFATDLKSEDLRTIVFVSLKLLIYANQK